MSSLTFQFYGPCPVTFYISVCLQMSANLKTELAVRTQTYKNAAKITKINHNNSTSPQASIELVLLILKTFKSSITVHRKSAIKTKSLT